jgi:two-component system response regulator YesN
VEDPELASADDRIALEQVLSEFSPREQEVIRMRFFEGLSQVDIAEAQGISQVQVSRLLRKTLMKIQEKLETIIPVVENGFVTGMLLSDDMQDEEYYRNLLEITEKDAYVEVIQFGTEDPSGGLLSPVESRVKAQDNYMQIRSVIKSFQRCIIGPVMSDRIVLVVPHEDETVTYDERIETINNMRSLLQRLSEMLSIRVRAGIGKICRFADLRMSYLEAVQALRDSRARVVHIEDISEHGVYEDDYPIELERDTFTALSRGDVAGVREKANVFFDWMERHDPMDLDSMRLKVLELVLRSEHDAFAAGSVNYAFDYRKDYLTQVNALQDVRQIRDWFLDHMTSIAGTIHNQAEEKDESTVARACKYIQEIFRQELSLDDVSKEVNVSPYYFSKLFKAEEGVNFIDYLTALRIEEARKMLSGDEFAVKEVGARVGYQDPNYFSRIFKKNTGYTPTEYKERCNEKTKQDK